MPAPEAPFIPLLFFGCPAERQREGLAAAAAREGRVRIEPNRVPDVLVCGSLFDAPRNLRPRKPKRNLVEALLSGSVDLRLRHRCVHAPRMVQKYRKNVGFAALFL
jgi:hypothetical protein